jgi:hypothetical protein
VGRPQLLENFADDPLPPGIERGFQAFGMNRGDPRCLSNKKELRAARVAVMDRSGGKYGYVPGLSALWDGSSASEVAGVAIDVCVGGRIVESDCFLSTARRLGPTFQRQGRNEAVCGSDDDSP